MWRLTGGEQNTLEELKKLGAEVPEDEIRQREQIAGPEDHASLVYTSGTVSDPRGAAITHKNLAQLSVNAVLELKEIVHAEASTVLLLPLAHILARFVQTAAFWAGVKITHVRDASRVVPIMKSAQPSFMVLVPRVMLKVLQAVRRSADEKKLGRLFDAAEHNAVLWGRHLEAVSYTHLTLPTTPYV